MGTQKNRLCETVPLGTQTDQFNNKLMVKKIITILFLKNLLNWSLDFCVCASGFKLGPDSREKFSLQEN